MKDPNSSPSVDFTIEAHLLSVIERLTQEKNRLEFVDRFNSELPNPDDSSLLTSS